MRALCGCMDYPLALKTRRSTGAEVAASGIKEISQTVRAN